MKYLLLLALNTSFTQLALADSPGAGFISAANELRQESNTSTQDEVEPVDLEEEVVSTTTVSDEVCKREDQTTLSQRFLKALLIEEGGMTYSHYPSSGLLKLYGGKMIGNCNAMIEPKVTRPSGNSSYTFSVQIKKSSVCPSEGQEHAGKCRYPVQIAENGYVTKDSPVDHFFEPNYDGFLECLKVSGVFVDGKVHKDKIAKVNFNPESLNNKDSGNLEFYCHGPICHDEKMQDKPSYTTNNSCEWIEKFKEKGGGNVRLVSKEERNANERAAAFKAACNEQDYKALVQMMQSFGSDEKVQLAEVRDNLIKSELKSLKKRFSKYRSLEKIKNADIKKMYELVKDFTKYIVNPLQADIENLIIQQEEAATDEEAERIQRKLDAKIAQLRELVTGEFFNLQDYNKMKDINKRPPLEMEMWREMALQVYKNSNASYHFQRYTTKNQNRKENDKKRMEVLYYDDLKEQMADHVESQREKLEMLGEAVANPGDPIHSAAYRQSALELKEDAQDELAFLVEEYQEGQQALQQCYNYGAQASQCMQNVSQRIDSLQNEITSTQDYYRDLITDDQNNYTTWAGIEDSIASWKGVSLKRVPAASNDFSAMSFSDILARTSGQQQTSTGQLSQQAIAQLLMQQRASQSGQLQNGLTLNTGLSGVYNPYLMQPQQRTNISPYANYQYYYQSRY